jgi:hypothetical protein
MPLTHQNNGVLMGGTLKDVSTKKKCYILAGSKDPLNLYMVHMRHRFSRASFKLNNFSFFSVCYFS